MVRVRSYGHRRAPRQTGGGNNVVAQVDRSKPATISRQHRKQFKGTQHYTKKVKEATQRIVDFFGDHLKGSRTVYNARRDQFKETGPSTFILELLPAVRRVHASRRYAAEGKKRRADRVATLEATVAQLTTDLQTVTAVAIAHGALLGEIQAVLLKCNLPDRLGTSAQ